MNNQMTRRFGQSANTILTLAIVLVAVVVIGAVLLLTRDGAQGGEEHGAVPAGILRNAESHTLLDTPGSNVTLVEFLDYQCPACASHYTNITNDLENDYAGRITFVTRNFPLQMHPLAEPAARAAEAAALQGKYREMYHALYDNFDSWATDGRGPSSDLDRAQARFDDFARQIGLDIARFHRDIDSEQVTQRIELDKADGKKAGVAGTPTFFINGVKFTPRGTSYAEVDAQFRAELDKLLAQ